MPAPARVPRPAALAAAVIAVVLSAAACGGGSWAASQASDSSTSAAATASAGTASTTPPQGLAVPGIPDPCTLLPPDAVLQAAHVESSAKSGAVPAAGGGRACAYNAGHPDAVTISLTPVSKAGFDTFRKELQGTVDVPGVGVEAYRTSQAPGVLDVFKSGFDLNVYVIHADSTTQAVADAKALAALLAAKL